jgi:hypothetical protein
MKKVKGNCCSRNCDMGIEKPYIVQEVGREYALMDMFRMHS